MKSPAALEDINLQRATVACAAVEWIGQLLRDDDWKPLLKLGARAVSVFLDIWRDAPIGSEVREISQKNAEICLEVLESALSRQEPLVGKTFLEALALLQYRAELCEGGACSDGASIALELQAVVVRSASAFINHDNFLSCPPAQLRDVRQHVTTAMEPDYFFKIPFYEVIGEYLTVEIAKTCCANVGAVLKTAAGLHDIIPIIQDIKLAWPGSRGAKNIEAALGSDLRLAAQIAGVQRCYGSAGTAAERSGHSWLQSFLEEAARLLLEDPAVDQVESLSFSLTALMDLGCRESNIINESRAFLISHSSGGGFIGGAPAPGLLWERIRPTWLAARAVQPRTHTACESWQQQFEKRRVALHAEFGVLFGLGCLDERAPPMDLSDWLGVPDFRAGEELPIVQPSAIGGERGRGLFVANGSKPQPIEMIPDPAYGVGGYLSEDVHDRISEEKSAGYDYIVLVTLGIWFRDEFSRGKHHGTVRPLSAALPRWLEEGRCAQEIHWDTNAQTYALSDYCNTVYVALDTSESLAAMANDALFLEACASEAEYERRDRTANNLVMVPCARPSSTDPEKVEFSRVWVYPRWAWHWEAGKPQELTLGYGWEESAQNIAVAD